MFLSISILTTYVGYMSSLVITHRKNSYSTIQDYRRYEDIGKLYVFKKARIVPVIQIMAESEVFKELDIFTTSSSNKTSTD